MLSQSKNTKLYSLLPKRVRQQTNCLNKSRAVFIKRPLIRAAEQAKSRGHYRQHFLITPKIEVEKASAFEVRGRDLRRLPAGW